MCASICRPASDASQLSSSDGAEDRVGETAIVRQPHTQQDRTGLPIVPCYAYASMSSCPFRVPGPASWLAPRVCPRPLVAICFTFPPLSTCWYGGTPVHVRRTGLAGESIRLLGVRIGRSTQASIDPMMMYRRGCESGLSSHISYDTCVRSRDPEVGHGHQA